MPEGLECLVRHRRAEIGSADADVDDVRDAVVASYAICEDGHLVEHVVNVGHDIRTVDHERPISRHAKCDVTDRPILGVDVLTGEHCIAAFLDTGRACEVEQHGEGSVVDRRLRPIDPEVACMHHVAVGTR